LLTPALPAPDTGETRSSEDGTLVAARRSLEPVAPASAGELWQRGLEAGVDIVAAREAQDRMRNALRDFDAARNAGPEAVFAFDAQAAADVRLLISPEVAEAKETLRHARAATGSPSAGYRAAGELVPVGIDGACIRHHCRHHAAVNGNTIRAVGDYYHERADIGAGKVTIWGWNATARRL
jgi:hypothetical protein